MSYANHLLMATQECLGITYIENNPVGENLCEKASDWMFSSAWLRQQHQSRHSEFALATWADETSAPSDWRTYAVNLNSR